MHFPPQPRGTWKSWQIFSNYLQFKHKSACSPHTHDMPWYAMQKVLPPTLATNLAMNIFAQNGSRQAGSTEQPFQTVCLARCILLGAGVKRFTWLPCSLINECRLAYLPPDQAQSQSPPTGSPTILTIFFLSFYQRKSFAEP